MALKVKRYKNGYGITDGKKWHAFYYPTQEKAEAILPKLIPEVVKVNVAYDEPVTFVSNPIL